MRSVEQLPVFPAHLHRSAQTLPAAQLVCNDLVRDRDLSQGQPGITGLPTGLAGAALAQRLRCGFGQATFPRRVDTTPNRSLPVLHPEIDLKSLAVVCGDVPLRDRNILDTSPYQD